MSETKVRVSTFDCTSFKFTNQLSSEKSLSSLKMTPKTIYEANSALEIRSDLQSNPKHRCFQGGIVNQHRSESQLEIESVEKTASTPHVF